MKQYPTDRRNFPSSVGRNRWRRGYLLLQRKGLAASCWVLLGVDMAESKRSIDDVRSFWMDAIFIALGVIALFASVALGLAVLMAE